MRSFLLALWKIIHLFHVIYKYINKTKTFEVFQNNQFFTNHDECFLVTENLCNKSINRYFSL